MSRLGPDGRPLLEWLTPLQYSALLAIYRFTVRERRYPVGRELCDELATLGTQCTVSRSYKIVDALIRKGYAERPEDGRRGLILTEAAVDKLQKEIQPELPGMPAT